MFACASFFFFIFLLRPGELTWNNPLNKEMGPLSWKASFRRIAINSWWRSADICGEKSLRGQTGRSAGDPPPLSFPVRDPEVNWYQLITAQSSVTGEQKKTDRESSSETIGRLASSVPLVCTAAQLWSAAHHELRCFVETDHRGAFNLVWFSFYACSHPAERLLPKVKLIKIPTAFKPHPLPPLNTWITPHPIRKPLCNYSSLKAIDKYRRFF